MTNDTKKPHLTVLPGGRELAALREKLEQIMPLPARKRMDEVLYDHDATRLAQAMHPLDFYRTAAEVGMSDAQEFLQLASPEQFRFCLDVELWRGWEYDGEKTLEWLKLLAEHEDLAKRVLQGLDIELLILFLKREIIVAGGIGDLLTDEERLAEWDHTFDDTYFISFRNKETSDFVMKFLDMLYRNWQQLYRTLLEGVKSEVESELEETAYHFRSGRLVDYGFPEAHEAVAIYSYVDPASWTSAGKKEMPAEPDEQLPVPASPPADSVLRAALEQASAGVHAELNYLLNNALVADGIDFSSAEGAAATARRVYGCLNIALEYLGADEGKGTELLETEPLRDLFRLGFSLLLRLQRKAATVTATEHAAQRLLEGLAGKRPAFYRGLDPDRADAFREFADMGDVLAVERALERLARQ